MDLKNHRVLITGAGGFIGSHLTEKCVELGLKVKAFIHYNSKNNWGWLETSQYKNEIEIVTGDIRDFDSVYDAVKDIDTVFHLAALIGIPYSYISPAAYIKTNIEGTYNTLQSAREHNIQNILITSTSETYGTAQYIPIDEKHPVVGQSPYSASKTSADQLAFSYFASFGLPVKIVRPFNTFGPRQSARAIIPTIITQLLDGKKIIKLGNTDTTRDFTFVDDTVNGFIKIAESDKAVGETFNIGSGYEISIKNLAKTIAKLINMDMKIEIEPERVRPDMSEVRRLQCDNTKIKTHCQWEPVYSLEQGLQKTIDWLKGNIEQYKSDIYNI